jgi:hypothetical protein
MFTLRPFLRTPLRLSVLSAASNTHLRRTMASSTSPKLQEWLVIIPDHADALQKRLGARAKHLEGLKEDREGMWLFGGMFCFSRKMTSYKVSTITNPSALRADAIVNSKGCLDCSMFQPSLQHSCVVSSHFPYPLKMYEQCQY